MAEVDIKQLKQEYAEWLAEEADDNQKLNFTFEMWAKEDYIQCEWSKLWYTSRDDFSDRIYEDEGIWVARDFEREYIRES